MKQSVLLLPVQINAYRPQMVPNSVDLSSTDAADMIIPQSEVSGTGVHIRVNGDSENTNLVKVTFSCPPLASMTGLTAAVQVSSTSLMVWSSSNKGTAIIGSNNQGNLTLDGSGNATIWVEALAAGGNDLTFPIMSGSTQIGVSGSLHFVNYDSFVVAFSGETAFGGTARTQGIFTIVQRLYLEGYNVGYYDVHGVDNGTGQPAYSEISNQANKCSVNSLGVFGYSHGGGQTYITCNLLSGALGICSIKFTGYVDAIAHTGPFNGTANFFAETRFPPGSAYHWNYYQRKDSLLCGNSVSGAAVNLNVTTTSWGSSLVHAGANAIVAKPQVQTDLQSAVESHVPKY